MSLLEQINALRAGALDDAGQRALLERALAAGQQDIALEVADHLAYMLLEAGNPTQAAAIARQALDWGQDFALLHTLALTEYALGKPEEAIKQLELAIKTLGLPDDDGHLILRADMLEHLATFCGEQGKSLRAWQALEQAAEIHLQLSNSEARARCLSQQAHLARGMGDNAQAADKWLDVLEATKNSNMTEASARALLELADIARDEGQPEAETKLHQEAIEALVEVGLWTELAQTLFRMARAQSRRDAAWQALWIMLARGGPMEDLVNVQAWLFMREDQKSQPEAAKVGAAVIAVIEGLSRNEPRHAENHRMAITHFLNCARLQGVHETEVTAWVEKERMLAEHGIVACVMTMIEDLEEIGEWLFDRSRLIHQV